ncbi:MAG: ribulose-phosphate 3-epimerase, partial [Candidatus Omnitrophica bacterium]|nr:ribulose-phosphate 3-epimerase [Candidatus Omnitrophota bacterium]
MDKEETMNCHQRKEFRLLPSLLSSDFTRLGDQVAELEKAGCDLVHLDIMDGHFVPNLTFGPPVVKSLSKFTDIAFDVHLMVDRPDDWIEAFDFPNTCSITIHAEAGYHVHRSLQSIQNRGKMAGLALNPATPLDCLEYLWPSLDLILVMTVNPGFGGQSFIPACEEKIARVGSLITEKGNPDTVLEIDGGINGDNLGPLAKKGAQWVVAGHSVFSQPDIGAGYRELQEIGTKNWGVRTLPMATTRKILVVDDNRLYREAVRRNLEFVDYQVLEAEDLPSALNEIRTQHPQAVITDLDMTHRTEGLDLIREVKTRYPLMPVILVSAVGTFEEGAKAQELGATAVISKSRIDEELEHLYANLDDIFEQVVAHKALKTKVEQLVTDFDPDQAVKVEED